MPLTRSVLFMSYLETVVHAVVGTKNKCTNFMVTLDTDRLSECSL